MRQIVFLCMLLFFIGFSKAQSPDDSWIIRKALEIPRSLTNSTTDIAAYITENFKTDKEKARAIYAWVTTNIRYSTDSANSINLGENQQAKITVALRRRKGVCENYAAIFNDIALKSGLTSFVVSGYTKQSGFVDKSGHSWCAVLIDKDWQLFDPTWDEGREPKSKYFMMAPSEFIETHIPYDPIWQLLNHPITQQHFFNSNIYQNKDTPYFNYADTINAYLQMDSLHKLQSSALRMQRDELSNKLVKDNYNFVKMHIEMINQDRDVDLYNSSVALINDATAVLNNFIQYRNNKFSPEKTDAELQALLEGVDTRLLSSLIKLDEIDKSHATFKIGTDQVRDRINALANRIKDQKDFVNTYIATEKNNRQSLFYK